MTTGSLGQGFSCAVGVALGSRLKGDGATIYTIIGDGESQEGQIWEAAMYAAHAKLGNLIAFTDYNRMQIDGNTDDINSLEPLDKKWESFNWNTIVIDGHDLTQIDEAIKNAKSQDRPTMIIAKTIKGKGVKSIEEKGFACHSLSLNEETVKAAIDEIRRAK